MSVCALVALATMAMASTGDPAPPRPWLWLTLSAFRMGESWVDSSTTPAFGVPPYPPVLLRSLFRMLLGRSVAIVGETAMVEPAEKAEAGCWGMVGERGPFYARDDWDEEGL